MSIVCVRTALKYLLANGDKTYGQPISVLDHALQTYWHLRTCNKKWLAVAGFWHDVGKTFFTAPTDQAAADMLADSFDGVFVTAILDVIRLHPVIEQYFDGKLSEHANVIIKAHPLYADLCLLHTAHRRAVDSTPPFDKAVMLLQAISDVLDIML